MGSKQRDGQKLGPLGFIAPIGYISTILGGSSKPGWALHPSPGAGKGEVTSRVPSGDGGKAILADAQMKAVEAVGVILFAHVDRAMARVSMYDFLEETGKCASKLHRFCWGKTDYFLVQV
jgi:hypothetical protein